ncbi:hypothetical protein AT6N2_C0674 [Agrobacterium tumefaciens]|nr:hypothetical protein AT6N2_C0674 [Agrobacterium tumefaciens]
MLPETMFLMEKIRRKENLRPQDEADEWQTWPSSRLDRLAVFLFHLTRTLRRYITLKSCDR